MGQAVAGRRPTGAADSPVSLAGPGERHRQSPADIPQPRSRRDHTLHQRFRLPAADALPLRPGRDTGAAPRHGGRLRGRGGEGARPAAMVTAGEQGRDGKALYLAGREHARRGDMVEAAQAWQEAAQQYQAAGDAEGQVRSLADLAAAYQALGSTAWRSGRSGPPSTSRRGPAPAPSRCSRATWARPTPSRASSARHASGSTWPWTAPPTTGPAAALLNRGSAAPPRRPPRRNSIPRPTGSSCRLSPARRPAAPARPKPIALPKRVRLASRARWKISPRPSRRRSVRETAATGRQGGYERRVLRRPRGRAPPTPRRGRAQPAC